MRLFILVSMVLLFQTTSFAQDDEPVLPDSIASVLDSNQKRTVKRFDALESAVEYLFNEDRYLEAVTYIDEMKIMADDFNNAGMKASSAFYGGTIDLLTDNLPDAYRELMTAKLFLSQVQSRDDIDLLTLRVNISLASYYITTKSNYTEAYKCLMAAKEANIKVKSDGYEEIINSNLIKVFNSLGLNEEAIRIGKKASASSEAAVVRKYTLFSNIADNYMNVSIDTAMMYLDSAFHFAHGNYEKAKILYGKGLCDMRSGNIAYAKVVFGNCLNVFSDALNHELTSLLLVEKGRSHFLLHEYDSALIYINKGIAEAHKHGFSAIELDGLSCKCDVLEDRNDYRRLAQCLKDYHHLKDSIHELNSADDVAYLMLESQFKEMETQLDHDAQVNKMKHSRLIYLVLTVAIALVSTIVIFSLTLSRKRILLKNKELKEKAMADQLDKQNREMVQQTLVQQQREDLVSDIVGKLKEMDDDKDEEANNYIKSVIGSLEGFSNVETPEDFEYYFTKTHPDFFKNLSNDYPNLSPSELKLCAYIKLNLSVKDIANITNIAPSSVHQARYRLKKDFGLENTEDINEFISRY